MELSADRPDYIFSYWIVIWFLLYFAEIVPYNPLYLFYMAIGVGIIQVGFMFSFRKSVAYIISFILGNIIMKGYPIYYLYSKNTYPVDVCVMSSLVALYFGWLIINGINIRRFIWEYLTPHKGGRFAFPVTNVIYDFLSRI